MGAGIAEVFARAGWSVAGVEADETARRRGLAILDQSTARAVATGKLSPDERGALLDRISTSTDRAAVAEAEIVVEAVVEDLATKRALFADLDRLAPRAKVLATNTSSLSVTAIAAATGRPGRVSVFISSTPPRSSRWSS